MYASTRDWPARRCRTLYSAEGVTITEHDAASRGEGCAIEGTSAGYRLIVTRRGAALLRRRTVFGAALAAEPLQAVLLDAGATYLLEPADAAHSFTVFTFSRELASPIVPCADPRSAGNELVATHSLIDSRLLIDVHRLRRALSTTGAGTDHSRSSVESDALALLRAVCDGHRARAEMASPRTQHRRLLAGRRRGEIVERVKCTLASAPEAAHALDSLSAPLGISTSLLAHVFPQETGLSPHRYLLHLRTALALAALSGGAKDLSRLALELGFATHSHFSAAFRRCTGMSPSEVRVALATCEPPTRLAVASTTSPPARHLRTPALAAPHQGFA